MRQNQVRGRGYAYLVVAACSLLCHRLYPLDPGKTVTQYVQEIWKTRSGLPVDSIQAILQTRDSYIWIGTQAGLVRFDGVTYSVYDTKNTKELKNSSIQCLCEDRQGNLWIGTESGLLCFRDGRFKAYTTKDGLPSNLVFALREDRKGGLWIGTIGGGITHMRDDRFTSFGSKDGLPSDMIASILEDRSGNLWIGTLGGGICRFRDGTFSSITTGEGLAHSNIHALYEDKRGDVWIGTDDGLNRYRDGKLQTYTTKDGLSFNFVSSILEDRDGNLWIGTRGGGVNRLTAGAFSTLTVQNGLSNENVICLMEDREGSLWIGTGGGGINQLKDGKFTTFTTKDGLISNGITSVMEDSRGDIWFTTNSGLTRYHGGNFNSYTTRNGLAANVITALCEDKRGVLWLGIVGKGVACLKGGKFVTIPIRGDNHVRAILEDCQGNLWIGTGGGLQRLRDGKFTAYSTRDGLSNNIIRVIHEDRAGNLWIATRNGLNRFRDGAFTVFTTNDGLSSNLVMSIHEDSEGTLWFGTWGGGLVRYRDGTFFPVTSSRGLAEDVVLHILEDGKGNLWMSSNKGIFRTSKKELTDLARGRRRGISCTVFGIADGMKSAECEGGITPAGWKTRSGKLWFPTVDGAVMIDPERIRRNDQPPPVIIERVLADENPAAVTGRMNFAPGTKKLEFHYAGLSFLVPEKVKFRYRLDGFDRDWVEAETRRTAFYTNLAPGRYTFRVTACNNDGVWNEAGAKVSFVLQPFFYQTTLFYILCGLAVVMTGLGSNYLHVKRLKKREKILSSLVDQRTSELSKAFDQLEHAYKDLEVANTELERLSLTDPLTKLPNRRNFELIYAQEWKRCSRESQPLTLLMVDIDFFKSYNDTYGHPMGDECLKQVAAAIHRCTSRAGDFVARLGGEEFVITLPNTPAQGAQIIAERVRSSVEESIIPHSSSPISAMVTISIGLATAVPNRDRESDSLIATADQALYQAKKLGRNRIHQALP